MIKEMLEQDGFTCNECRWKTEQKTCPWDFQYEGTKYAEDCIDFRYVNDEKDAFKDN